jgi:serine O-acetyltransferase
MTSVPRIFALPAIIGFWLTNRKDVIIADVKRWAELEKKPFAMPGSLVDMVAAKDEFRTLLHHRLYHGNAAGKMFARIYFVVVKRKPTLYLSLDEIGSGLYIQHGYSTGIDARRIGKNVWINQLVTIGHGVNKDGSLGLPTIEDGVSIFTGATILGDITVGHDSVIGAGAVVVKDVPPEHLAVGVPAKVKPLPQAAAAEAVETISGQTPP